MSPAEKGALKQQFGSPAFGEILLLHFVVSLWSVGSNRKSHHPGKDDQLEAPALPSQGAGPQGGLSGGWTGQRP